VAPMRGEVYALPEDERRAIRARQLADGRALEGVHGPEFDGFDVTGIWED